MDEYIARANFNSNLSSKSASFKSEVSSQLLPKPLLIPSYQIEDTELSIFDAKHYFNEGHELQNTIKRPRVCDACTKPRDMYWRISHPFRTTPTSSSEASWNGRSGLLSNSPGSVSSCAVDKRSKPRSRNFFFRNCPCYGEKSVDVEEKYSSPVHFSAEKEHPTISNSMKISAGVNWEKEFPGFTFPIPAQTKSGDDDVASDTSSDLFEIESFGTNSMYHRRDSLNEYLKLGPSEC